MGKELDELKECKNRSEMAAKLFAALDDDGSGEIDIFEFKAQWSKGSEKEDQRAEKIFKKFDDDKSGQLSEKEFVSHYLDVHKDDNDDAFLKGAANDLKIFRDIVAL